MGKSLVDLRAAFVPETEPLAGLSLCAGYGGLDLGLHIAEPAYRTVGYVERNSHSTAALVARMADQALGDAPVWDDLRTFDGRPWRGRVHLVSAGYPCQPFSTAGHRRGADDPRHLWPDVARIVREVGPEWVFCENVEGHLDLGLPDVVGELQAMGYEAKVGLFTAREVGARHRRRRIFILAHADSERRGLCAGSDPDGRRGEAGIPGGHFGGERRAIFAFGDDPKLDDVVADPEGGGLVGGDGDLPLFAPGPGELQAWENLIDRRPDLQPAVLRAEHGLADRLDRTSGAGNGVCSMVAALAWATLKADFTG